MTGDVKMPAFLPTLHPLTLPLMSFNRVMKTDLIHVQILMLKHHNHRHPKRLFKQVAREATVANLMKHNLIKSRIIRPPQSGGINWENLCNQYGHLVGIKDPCYEYASGTQLPEKGKTALVCLLVGGITLLASLDPATKAEIIALGQQYCP
jgi:hypothetical protein